MTIDNVSPRNEQSHQVLPTLPSLNPNKPWAISTLDSRRRLPELHSEIKLIQELIASKSKDKSNF